MRLVAGGAGRVRKEPLRRAKPTARRETGEGEIEKPLGHHWVMALYKYALGYLVITLPQPLHGFSEAKGRMRPGGMTW